ncbi:MAG: hypothetical protein H6685_11175 [Deltaproteobacteria bacterium]|nr:hypothetical protein [Deltaproteobacteria bacterium]
MKRSIGYDLGLFVDGEWDWSDWPIVEKELQAKETEAAEGFFDYLGQLLFVCSKGAEKTRRFYQAPTHSQGAQSRQKAKNKRKGPRNLSNGHIVSCRDEKRCK